MIVTGTSFSLGVCAVSGVIFPLLRSVAWIFVGCLVLFYVVYSLLRRFCFVCCFCCWCRWCSFTFSQISRAFFEMHYYSHYWEHDFAQGTGWMLALHVAILSASCCRHTFRCVEYSVGSTSTLQSGHVIFAAIICSVVICE